MQPEPAIVRERLLTLRRELRDELAGGMRSGATVELDQSRVGRLSRMDALQVQAMSQEASRRLQGRIAAVDTALARVQSGEYGDCNECGAAINPKRLEVNPLATLCINCASRRES